MTASLRLCFDHVVCELNNDREPRKRKQNGIVCQLRRNDSVIMRNRNIKVKIWLGVRQTHVILQDKNQIVIKSILDLITIN